MIAQVDVQALDLPLIEPFGISGGSQAAANNVLVTVHLQDGTQGCGEAAPLPAYNGESQAAALAHLEAARAWAVGRSEDDWEALGLELAQRARGRSCGAARCALETALLDARTRSLGQPLWRHFGAAGTTLETDLTIPTGTREHAERSARAIRERGIRIIKVKVGGETGPRHDVARIAAVRDAAPGSPLILDGNAGLTRAYAAELVRGLRANRIEPELLEQWLAPEDLAGLRALHDETGWRVAADESAVGVADIEALARAGAAQVVNIKLMKAGIAEAMRVAETARRLGLGLMIGGNVESILGMTASACFAAGRGGFAYADLDTPLFIAAHPFTGGYRLLGATVSVTHVTAGHGVAPVR